VEGSANVEDPDKQDREQSVKANEKGKNFAGEKEGSVVVVVDYVGLDEYMRHVGQWEENDGKKEKKLKEKRSDSYNVKRTEALVQDEAAL
jgi:hypothetical protein